MNNDVIVVLMSEKSILYNSILTDLGTFSLVLMVCSIVLFSFFYFVIISKKGESTELSEKIKRGDIDTYIHRDLKKHILEIKHIKRIRIYLMISFSIGVTNYLLCFAAKYLIDLEKTKRIFTINLGVFSAFILIYVTILIIIGIRSFVRQTKI
ncbi:MAG: hypothetical protein GY760_12455 [Deltaproteobacteria bacterium]|nr:hypothetical protein [Deltaproteobacteria bacterium]